VLRTGGHTVAIGVTIAARGTLLVRGLSWRVRGRTRPPWWGGYVTTGAVALD